jgi:quinol-cytochrome oxidoreductase complex cytochrome b subunit
MNILNTISGQWNIYMIMSRNSLTQVHQIVTTGKNHIYSYPCPTNINIHYKIGFLLSLVLIGQILSGITISLQYTSDIYSCYYCCINM